MLQSPSSTNKTYFKYSFPDALRLTEMVPVLKKLSLDTIEPIATSVLWCKLRSVYDY